MFQTMSNVVLAICITCYSFEAHTLLLTATLDMEEQFKCKMPFFFKEGVSLQMHHCAWHVDEHFIRMDNE